MQNLRLLHWRHLFQMMWHLHFGLELRLDPLLLPMIVVRIERLTDIERHRHHHHLLTVVV
jgi:hypothetical protein